MRILILGAGGIGGYIGARLLATGQADVSFLVRERRWQQLQQYGLQVESQFGNLSIAGPQTCKEIQQVFDVVILSCKAYDLPSAMEAIAPAVGQNTLLIPLLNGIAHLDVLDQRFGRSLVAGGVVQFSATLTADGRVLHLNDFHRVIVGARTAHSSPWFAELAALFALTPMEFHVKPAIEQEMWNKFVFLTTLAATTCSMRAAIGDILAFDGGRQFILSLLQECEQVAIASGQAPTSDDMQNYVRLLTTVDSVHTASMLRDLEGKQQTEADHIVGDMLRRAHAHKLASPQLELAWLHLQAASRRRARLAEAD